MTDTFDATGIWRGTAELNGDTLAVRTNLSDDRGSLRGVIFFGDPNVGQLVGLGAVTGTRTSSTATWHTTTGAALTGTFGGDTFDGTLAMTRPDTSVVNAALHLARVPVRRQRFTPITPSRLVDTREDYYEPLEEGDTITVGVTGRFGIPYEGVAAVVVNITGTEARGPGYVTAWASGNERPGTANLNLERSGQTAGNLAVVPVGSNGYIQLFTQNGTHLIVDAFGWFSTTSILQTCTQPTRVLDTRSVSYVGYTGSKPGPGSTVAVALAGAGGMPASGVSAAIVNIAATEATAPGYITAWADGRPQPFTANLNVDAVGQTIANLAIVPVSADGTMRLFTQSGTHLVVDLFGWFPIETGDSGPANPPGADGNLVIDGSFEASTTIAGQASYRTISNDTVGAWMVTNNGVDLVGPGQATAFDGDQFVDLNGNGYGPGTLEQLVSTAPDRQYRISFMMSGNPNGSPTVKELEVTFGDARKQFSFDVTGHTNAALGWTECSLIANPDCGSSTSLGFRSLTVGDRGPNIDAVRVVDAGPGTGCSLGGYRSLDPARLLDTRAGSLVGYTGDKPGAAAEVRVQVAGVAGISASGVAAVAVNITATEATGPGYITAWPSGTARPTTSSLNLEYAGETRGNHAIVPVGSDGAISLFTQSGTHLVVDAFGWFT